MHQSEAEERAERAEHVRLMRAARARLLWGLERMPGGYSREQMADYLTGCVGLTVIGGPDLNGSDGSDEGAREAGGLDAVYEAAYRADIQNFDPESRSAISRALAIAHGAADLPANSDD